MLHDHIIFIKKNYIHQTLVIIVRGGRFGRSISKNGNNSGPFPISIDGQMREKLRFRPPKLVTRLSRIGVRHLEVGEKKSLREGEGYFVGGV